MHAFALQTVLLYDQPMPDCLYLYYYVISRNLCTSDCSIIYPQMYRLIRAHLQSGHALSAMMVECEQFNYLTFIRDKIQ